MGERGGPSRDEAYEEFRRKVEADKRAAEDAAARINPAGDFESREETETDIDRQVEEQLGPVGYREKEQIGTDEQTRMDRITTNPRGEYVVPSGTRYAEERYEAAAAGRLSPSAETPPSDGPRSIVPPEALITFERTLSGSLAKQEATFDLPPQSATIDRQHAENVALILGALHTIRGIHAANESQGAGTRMSAEEEQLLAKIQSEITEIEKRRTSANASFTVELVMKKNSEAARVILDTDVAQSESELPTLTAYRQDLENILARLPH